MYVVQQAAYPAISPHRGIPPSIPEGPGALEQDKGSYRHTTQDEEVGSGTDPPRWRPARQLAGSGMPWYANR